MSLCARGTVSSTPHQISVPTTPTSAARITMRAQLGAPARRGPHRRAHRDPCERYEGDSILDHRALSGVTLAAAPRFPALLGTGSPEPARLLAVFGEFVAKEADKIAMVGEDVRFGRGAGRCRRAGLHRRSWLAMDARDKSADRTAGMRGHKFRGFDFDAMDRAVVRRSGLVI